MFHRYYESTSRTIGSMYEEYSYCWTLAIYPYHPWDWYIYLHEWLIFMVNVGKYSIHGCYGICSIVWLKKYYLLKISDVFFRNIKVNSTSVADIINLNTDTTFRANPRCNSWSLITPKLWTTLMAASTSCILRHHPGTLSKKKGTMGAPAKNHRIDICFLQVFFVNWTTQISTQGTLVG